MDKEYEDFLKEILLPKFGVLVNKVSSRIRTFNGVIFSGLGWGMLSHQKINGVGWGFGNDILPMVSESINFLNTNTPNGMMFGKFGNNNNRYLKRWCLDVLCDDYDPNKNEYGMIHFQSEDGSECFAILNKEINACYPNRINIFPIPGIRDINCLPGVIKKRIRETMIKRNYPVCSFNNGIVEILYNEKIDIIKLYNNVSFDTWTSLSDEQVY